MKLIQCFKIVDTVSDQINLIENQERKTHQRFIEKTAQYFKGNYHGQEMRQVFKISSIIVKYGKKSCTRRKHLTPL